MYLSHSGQHNSYLMWVVSASIVVPAKYLTGKKGGMNASYEMDP